MDHFFSEQLYPLQDLVLRELSSVETGFYLSGGTALSRGYLNHRYSDDLDFFVDDNDHFELWSDRFIFTLSKSKNWNFLVSQREERCTRLTLHQAEIDLKIDMINDVPSRIGEPWLHPILGRIDTAENILANKVTAVLDRDAPKDLADIWGLCCMNHFSIQAAITGAQGKASGVFPVDLARVLFSADFSDWEVIRWISRPDPQVFVQQLHDLAESLILS